MKILPMEIPSRTNFVHAVMTIRVVGFRSFRVLERATSYGVDAYENNQHHDVKHRQFVPVSPDIFQYPCLARVALVA